MNGTGAMAAFVCEVTETDEYNRSFIPKRA